MTDYYRGSTSGNVILSVIGSSTDCTPECISEEQWDCSADGILYNTGDPCTHHGGSDTLLLVGIGVAAIAGLFLLSRR
jgi:hypothetical protein